MIATVRAFAKSWFAAALIGLLILSFAVFGIHDVFKGGAASQEVINAGPRAVSQTVFKRNFDNIRKTYEQQSGQPISNEVAAENGLDSRVLEELATREAWGAMLSKMGVNPSDAMLAAELQKIPAFLNQITGQFDKAAYTRTLQENGFTPDQFEQEMRDQIADNQVVAAMVNGLRVPRAYSALGAIYAMESRDVGYFTLDPRSVPQPALPTDAALIQLM